MADKWFPRISVEKLADKNIPKNKTDDKQLRQAQIGDVENDASADILEIILADGTVERYYVDGVVLSFLQLDQG